MVITTNAQLRVDHVVELQNLKGDTLDSVQVWHRELLESKLVAHPFLCHFYFGDPQFPAFVPTDLYVENNESKLLESPLIGREEVLQTFIDQVSDTNNSVHVIHAPGGFGKSHFLKEAAERLDVERPDSQVFHVRPALRDLRSAFQDELVSGRSYILILDDADRYPMETGHLLAFTKANASLTLILGCRTAGRSLIQHKLHSQNVDSHFRELQPLSEPALKEILDLSAGEEVRRSEQIIQVLNGIPYLLTLYGRSIRQGFGQEEIEKVHDRLVGLTSDDAHKILQKILPSEAEEAELLLHLATIVPFHCTPPVLETLGQGLGKPQSIIEIAINELIEGKLLRRVGNSIRFYPDMAGDLFLAGALSSHPQRIQGLLEAWYGLFPSQIVANLASAAPYEKSDAIRSIFSEMVRTWIRQTEADEPYLWKVKLNRLERIAYFCPEESLNLIYAILDQQGDDPEVSRDDLGPVVLVLSHHIDYQLDVLGLIVKLHELNLEGTYANYTMSSLVAALISPLDKPPSVIEQTLHEILRSAQSPEATYDEVAVAAIAAKGMLAGGYEYSESSRRGVTVGEKVLRDIPEVHNLRDVGFEILKALLHNRDNARTALDVAEEIGTRRMHSGDSEVPLSERFGRDREAFVKEVESLDLNSADLVFLSDLEDLMMKWWLMESGGAE